MCASLITNIAINERTGNNRYLKPARTVPALENNYYFIVCSIMFKIFCPMPLCDGDFIILIIPSLKNVNDGNLCKNSLQF